MSKILAVFGATGNQGGSVVRAVLADPVLSKEFNVRAVTRDASKPAAKALADLGVEVVVADMSTPEQAAPAVKDAHTVFLVTNFWESMDAALEVVQGKAVTDAAKAANVKHIIFSGVLSITELTKGRLRHAEHFDSKAEIEKYIRNSGVPGTFFHPGFFMTNLVHLPCVKIHEDALKKGEYRLEMPLDPTKAQLPLFDVRDTGKYVKVALKKFPELVNTQMSGAADYYTPDRIAAEFAAVTGKPARAAQLSDDGFFAEWPWPNTAQDIFENLKVMQCEGYFGGADLNRTLSLLEDKATTWMDFVKEHQDQILSQA